MAAMELMLYFMSILKGPLSSPARSFSNPHLSILFSYPVSEKLKAKNALKVTRHVTSKKEFTDLSFPLLTRPSLIKQLESNIDPSMDKRG